MTPDLEILIRQRAYEIWEADGRPHGRDKDHWTRAVHELANGKAAAASLRPPAETVVPPLKTAKPATPPAQPAAKSVKKAPAKAAPRKKT